MLSGEESLDDLIIKTRPVQTLYVGVQALGHIFNLVARGMNPFGVCRAPPGGGGLRQPMLCPETGFFFYIKESEERMLYFFS